DQLSPEDQAVLMRTARRAGEALDRVVRQDDAEAYEVMIRRGIQVVDTTPYRAQWEAAGEATRDALVGRIYSKSLLQEVQAAAAAQ
ncbi:MAG: hypothetical protein AAF436_13860, partial [Myxococcota bacterium]